MSGSTITAEYKARIEELEAEWSRSRRRHTVAAAVTVAAVALVVILGAYAIQQRIPAWWPALPVPVAAAAALRYRLFAVARSRAWRLKHFYQQGIQRIDGTWPGKGSSGDEFSDSSHLYAHDLNVFGEGSLFELLSIARTAIGRRGLANYLLDTPDLNEIVARQEAVRELEPSKSLREALAVLGEYEFCDAKWGTFAGWLESPPASFPRSLAPIAAVTSSLVAATARPAKSLLCS